MEIDPLDISKTVVETQIKEEVKKQGLSRLATIFFSVAFFIYVIWQIISSIFFAIDRDPTTNELNRILGYVRTISGIPIPNFSIVVIGTQVDGGQGNRSTNTDSNGFFCFNSLDIFKSESDLTLRFLKNQKLIKEIKIADRSPRIHIEQTFEEELLK